MLCLLKHKFWSGVSTIDPIVANRIVVTCLFITSEIRISDCDIFGDGAEIPPDLMDGAVSEKVLEGKNSSKEAERDKVAAVGLSSNESTIKGEHSKVLVTGDGAEIPPDMTSEISEKAFGGKKISNESDREKEEPVILSRTESTIKEEPGKNLATPNKKKGRMFILRFMI